MRTILVVFDAVLLCQHLCFQKAAEDFPVEELVPQFVVEALDVAVFLRASWGDVNALHLLFLEPVLDGIGNELWAVVATDVLRHAVAVLWPLPPR